MRCLAIEIDDLMNFSHEMRWLWVLAKRSLRWRTKCRILLPSESLSLSFFTETKKRNVYDFSCHSLFAVLENLWRWLIKFAKFLVGGRAGKKQPTKVRAKQPKASKKVKFISEYRGVIRNRFLMPKCHRFMLACWATLCSWKKFLFWQLNLSWLFAPYGDN